jgi:plastocyanin
MAGQSWSINIVPSSEKPDDKSVSFNPDVYDCPPGSPLKAQVGDLVSWNNQTNNPHQIVVEGETLDCNPWSSTTAYQIQTTAKSPIVYTCDEDCTGQIEVVS